MRKTSLFASLFVVHLSTCTLATLTISGTITEAERVGLPDVIVSSDNGGGSATTDSSGYYSIEVPQGWSGRVTPTKGEYLFQPAYRDYSSVTDNQTHQDFLGMPTVPKVATPTFSSTGGAYTNSVTVAIICATDGAAIYFTTDSSEPTESSSVYTDAINITSPMTLKAKAFKPGLSPSNTIQGYYDILTSTPTFTPSGGGFSGPVMVLITCDTPEAVIRYTLDSTEPTESSDVYTVPILLGDTVIKAKAWKTGKTPSKTKTALYVIGPGLADDPNELDNGDFEDGDSSLTLYNFTPPVRWKRITHQASNNQIDCFASLYSSFTPGSANWEIPQSFEGNSFTVLSTGGFDDVDDHDIRGSMLSQQIHLSAGDSIVGAYFFGTTDYLPYNDYAQISLELAVDPNLYPDSLTSFVIPDTYCDVETVGNLQSTNDWVCFSHTVESNQVGDYFLRCEVVDDQKDTIVNSYLAVDGLRICRDGKPDGDLNYDCEVTLIDFAYLANYWGLTGCNSGTDCGRADIDGSGDVGLGDFVYIAQDWLE